MSSKEKLPQNFEPKALHATARYGRVIREVAGWSIPLAILSGLNPVVFVLIWGFLWVLTLTHRIDRY
ncbi:hypothetical protein [Xylocopilactobacillus apicola]|uniref:Uncharacterized protein n=1 Tax=Xylocopilactobacillus apicola TaxID=2932184 RepID=A0AAU9D4K8_9LACO|nr:hypothetical protein [Xylocopilactobacillus apicola]BDR58704.1 hypothetical protein XA3_11450 [Xylocopilactobacillus apicola]